jgi:hypothetical protein
MLDDARRHVHPHIPAMSSTPSSHGELHRDADIVLPVIADRWGPGDRIPILYLPDRGYDSVIVAVE